MTLEKADGMGALCSSTDKDGEEPSEGKSPSHLSSPVPKRLHKMPHFGRPGTRSQQNWRAAINNRDFEDETEYTKALEQLQLAERSRAFDAETRARASKIETEAAALVLKIRAYDWDNTYGKSHDAQGNPTGKRTEGEHFLGNVDLINKTELMKVARHMPKGAHLHIHFNSCLPARFLIQQARDIDAMYIRSTLPLTSPKNMAAARISFMVMTPEEATHTKDATGKQTYVPLGNVWDAAYICNTWMPYKKFQRHFNFVDSGHSLKGTPGAEIWLERKMLISEEEACGVHQTGRG